MKIMKSPGSKFIEDWITVARAVLLAEAQTTVGAAGRLDQSLARAVQLIPDHDGKVGVSGSGNPCHFKR